MSQAHAERDHALLSASQAERWLNCPPSARLQEGIPDKTSEYAAEGTTAHELSETLLRWRILPYNPKQREKLEKRFEEIKTSKYYNAEMEEAIQFYIDFVCERFFAFKSRSSDAVVLLEERLDFSEWVPEGFGTGDVVIISDGVMEVIDLKYGKGIPVSAVGNPQMRLYALGAWAAHNWLYDIREVQMTIVQPRLDSISTDTVLIEELIEWGEYTVKPVAALAWEGKGEFKAGNHCRWCKVKATCRARAEANMEALKYEFQDPALLSHEEIGSILFIADQLKAWAKDVEEYAHEQALKGEKIPQWKLVEGRSNRIITDEEALKQRLREAGFKLKDITETKLLGVSKLEKVVTKKKLAEIAGDLIIKPQGKPVLVPETDKRPALNSIEHEFANIDMEVDQ
ncbi:DUF2800 domain-containing protein [Aeribacillus composti]|uniref:DUF2800 domain-containing protein n=1 Tax=Aeribacillus composti TaxID=1868734 RepID=UPI00406A4081